ncbi:MAG: permease-like cell division protein FtsX, partial [Vitreoscilla sp.]|nr:permease-like cell division protein FtsX [Vitreoscilla sp.]
ALTLPLALYLVVQSNQQMLGQLTSTPQITVFMALSAEQKDVDALQAELRKRHELSKIEYVSKQKALADMQQSMGEQDLVSMLDENPLPDAFVLTPKAELNPNQLQTLQADLGGLAMVDLAQMDAQWMQTLHRINHVVHQLVWFLAITLCLAFVLVAHNTIRLQILSQKEEIEITKLLGAPSSFIRRPFLYQAWWQGCLALLISLGLCWYLIRLSTPMLQALFAPYGLQLTWRFFTLPELLILLGLMSVLAVFGATFATRQHLRHFRARTH